MLMTWYGFAENSRAEEEKYVQHKVTVTISDEQDKSQTAVQKRKSLTEYIKTMKSQII